MRLRGLVPLCAFLTAAGVCAQSISGTILIKRKLTKPGLTAPVSVYQ